MNSIVLVGLQWGDEGKGKIADYYAKKMDIVCRFNGGNNAGHTIVVGGEKTILHLIPSGILHENVMCFIGSGTVVNPEVFLSEINKLTKAGIKDIEKRLFLSDRASLLLDYHVLIDELREKRIKIGTTKRGIGPAYEDKVGRRALRVCDLLNPELLKEKLEILSKEKTFNGMSEPVTGLSQKLEKISIEIKPYIADVRALLRDAVKSGKKVLFEGAQGVLLDVDFGTYPYVTSSHTLPYAAPIGMGVPLPKDVKFVGVMKAYTTRVGEGPFPTEIDGEEGERIRSLGGEYGATTGRPRRCGWLDLVSLKYAIEVSGVEYLALTKADVLCSFSEIKVCTAYKLNDTLFTTLPADTSLFSKLRPVYEVLEGWGELAATKKAPKNLLTFIQRIEDFTGTKVVLVSTGPERNAVIEI